MISAFVTAVIGVTNYFLITQITVKSGEKVTFNFLKIENKSYIKESFSGFIPWSTSQNYTYKKYTWEFKI